MSIKKIRTRVSVTDIYNTLADVVNRNADTPTEALDVIVEIQTATTWILDDVTKQIKEGELNG